MCALTAQNEDACIKSLSDKPTVECGNCGVLANNPENVCDPRPLPNISAAVA
jgi:hypothetical protein